MTWIKVIFARSEIFHFFDFSRKESENYIQNNPGKVVTWLKVLQKFVKALKSLFEEARKKNAQIMPQSGNVNFH